MDIGNSSPCCAANDSKRKPPVLDHCESVEDGTPLQPSDRIAFTMQGCDQVTALFIVS
jgi:hypothetical protein